MHITLLYSKCTKFGCHSLNYFCIISLLNNMDDRLEWLMNKFDRESITLYNAPASVCIRLEQSAVFRASSINTKWLQQSLIMLLHIYSKMNSVITLDWYGRISLHIITMITDEKLKWSQPRDWTLEPEIHRQAFQPTGPKRNSSLDWETRTAYKTLR